MTIDKVKELLAAQLNISKDKIQDDSKLVEDLGADSLDMVEMQCENKFVKLDEKLFKELSKSAREIYETQKKSTK